MTINKVVFPRINKDSYPDVEGWSSRFDVIIFDGASEYKGFIITSLVIAGAIEIKLIIADLKWALKWAFDIFKMSTTYFYN